MLETRTVFDALVVVLKTLITTGRVSFTACVQTTIDLMSAVAATLLDFFLPKDLAPLIFWFIHLEIITTVCVVW